MPHFKSDFSANEDIIIEFLIVSFWLVENMRTSGGVPKVHANSAGYAYVQVSLSKIPNFVLSTV